MEEVAKKYAPGSIFEAKAGYKAAVFTPGDSIADLLMGSLSSGYSSKSGWPFSPEPRQG